MNETPIELDELVDYIFTSNPITLQKLVMQLDTQDEKGDIVDSNIYDVFGFLINMAVKGFIKLQLDPDNLDESIRKLNRYFNCVSFKIMVRQFEGTSEVLPPCCKLMFSKTGCNVNYNPYHVRNYNRELEEIYCIIGDYAIYFTIT